MPPGPRPVVPKLTSRQLSNVFATTRPKGPTLPVDREHAGLSKYPVVPKLSADQLSTLFTTGGGNNPNEHVGVNNADKLAQFYTGINNASRTGSSTGGGSSSGSGAAAAPELQNPFGPAYDAMIAAARTNGADDLASLQKLRDGIGANYDNATKGLYNQYNGARTELDQQADNLGVKPQDIYKDYDAHLRGIQEQSDQAKANDQSWTDKMISLRKTDLDNLYTSLAEQQQVQMANWAAATAARALANSGGGSGHSSGHSSSSSSSSPTNTETATSTDTVNDPDYQAAVASLANDPTAQALYISTHNTTNGNPDSSKLQTLLNQVPADRSTNKNPVITPKLIARYGSPSPWPGSGTITPKSAAVTAANGINFINKALNSQNSKTRNTIIKALNAAIGAGGGNGVPKSTDKITTTGKTKVKAS